VVTIWIAALMLIGSVALFVAAPLTEVFTTRRHAVDDDAEAARLEHQRSLATAAIRELEFDYATGKISEPDFRAIRRRLEERALEAMAGLDRLHGDRSAAKSPQGTD